MKPFTVLGHRGAKGHAPENTLVSFRKAIELGANMVELDVHLSKDGHLIVIHDIDVDRTTNGTGRVADLTLAEIKALDAGSWFDPQYAGEQVPTLQEVIDVIKGKMLLNVEIKKGAELYPGIVELVAKTIKENDMVDQVVVSSFSTEYLQEMRQALPEIEVAWLYSREEANPVQRAVQEGWQALHPNIQRVTRELVDEAHAHGLLVRGWNPNDEAGMRKLIECGVDGVGTDFPEVLLRLAREYGVLS